MNDGPVLINTLDNPGEFDILTSLRPGEPYIVLAGRDRFAPPLVLQWAQQNRSRALQDFTEGRIDEPSKVRELRKSTDAEEIAWAMQAYKAGYDEKAATAKQPDSYTGFVPTEEQARRDALQKARVDSAQAVNNAVGEMTDLLALIDPHTHEARCIRETIKAMNACREVFRIKRPGIDRDAEPPAYGPGREA